MKKALILVDIQNDFCAHGALEVPDGDAVVPLANALMPHFEVVVATQDWHPANHASFAANHAWRKPYQVIQLNGLPQTLWPIHCVQHTFGARLHRDLDKSKIHKIVYKGTDSHIDSYSGFFDNGQLKATEMHAYLQSQSVRKLYVMGLATDYCVRYTALDAVSLGYEVMLIQDACRGVELHTGDIQAALDEMQEKGVKLLTSKADFEIL